MLKPCGLCLLRLACKKLVSCPLPLDMWVVFSCSSFSFSCLSVALAGLAEMLLLWLTFLFVLCARVDLVDLVDLLSLWLTSVFCSLCTKFGLTLVLSSPTAICCNEKLGRS